FCPWNTKKEGPAGAAAWMRQQEVTILSTPSTPFRAFVQTLSEGARFPSVRLLRLWAEPSYRRDFEAFCRWFPDSCSLANRFGSTETGSVCWRFYSKKSRWEGTSLPLGYPTEGHEILLFDEAGREPAPGETGEIVVRSRYLSPGYWRRPEQTDAAFSADPSEPGVRWYRTGDLGRFLPDGCLVHAGRKDFQVKIRG